MLQSTNSDNKIIPELVKSDFKPNPLTKTLKNEPMNPIHLKTIEEDKQNEKTCSSKKVPAKSQKISKTRKTGNMKSDEDESEYSESSDESDDSDDNTDNDSPSPVKQQQCNPKLLNTQEYFATAKSNSTISNPLQSQTNLKTVSDINSTNFRLTKNTWGKIDSQNGSMKASKVTNKSNPSQQRTSQNQRNAIVRDESSKTQQKLLISR